MNEVVTKICGVLRHAVVVGVSIPVVLSVENAAAASFCSSIDLLIEEAPQDFSGIVVEPRKVSGGYDVTFKLEGASNCAARQLLNGKSYYCTWEFQHRDAKAYATFDNLSQELQSCISDRAALSDDQSVNHPDFYDSRIFLLDLVKVAVSVKDKSALGSTFIFVTVEPRIGI